MDFRIIEYWSRKLFVYGSDYRRPMKSIGIFTRNFPIFHDIVHLLKESNTEFISLNCGNPPPWISVVITTPESSHEVQADHVLIATEETIKDVVEQAILYLSKSDRYHEIKIGIDPGEKPGIAVYGDGELLTTAKMEFPEDCAFYIKRILDFYSADSVSINIGDGAPTYRNRIINILLPLGINIEIVDERKTSYHKRSPDIHAAMKIGLKKGRIINDVQDVRPTEGEINDIKRRSRILSKGLFTISRKRAESVARGDITLHEAVADIRRSIMGNDEIDDEQ